MRRRWKLLVAVGAISLIAGVLFLFPPRDDGLDWIRKYGLAPQGERMVVIGPGSSHIPGIEKWFTFAQAPIGFEEELRRKMVHERPVKSRVLGGTLPNRWEVSFYLDGKELYLFRRGVPNWFERQFTLLKRRFGAGP